MGNSRPSTYFNDQTWKPLDPGGTLFACRNAPLRLERREIVFQSRTEFLEEEARYLARLKPPPNVVGVVSFIQLNVSFSCNLSYRGELVIQHFEERLSDLECEEEKALYILKEALTGFSHLARTTERPFQVFSNYIAVGRNDTVKVWYNQDFSSNHPAYLLPYRLPPAEVQHRLVEKLLQLARFSTKSKAFTPRFSQLLRQGLSQPFTVGSVQKIIKEYALEQHLLIQELQTERKSTAQTRPASSERPRFFR